MIDPQAASFVAARFAIVLLTALLLVPVAILSGRFGVAYLGTRANRYIGVEGASSHQLVALIFAILMAICAFAVIPFSGGVDIAARAFSASVAESHSGVVLALAVIPLGVFAVEVARPERLLRLAMLLACTTIVMALVAAALFMMNGSMSIEEIVLDQGAHMWWWNVARQPFSFVLFTGAALALCTELIDDSSNRLRQVACLLLVIAMAALISALFLGGWQIPFVASDSIAHAVKGAFVFDGWELYSWTPSVVAVAAQTGCMFAKTAIVSALLIWGAGYLPHLRKRWIAKGGFTIAIPLAIANLILTATAMLIIG